MKCHYEVLGISMDADSDTLKKSYRKLALLWHPDKNLENADEATEIFRQIQQAYDVLSDPQERAWYDKHREVILKGGLGSGDYSDDSVNVFPYFTASCYTGFHDDEGGFYKVYGDVFSKIATEDIEFTTDKNSDFEIPIFGTSESSYEEVVHPFYAYWSSYCTLKSFVWAEKYDTREAPNRRISRLMEKDNKKLRDQARKKRNEEVRALVSFVRKRDKRVQAYRQLLEKRATENVKKSEEIRRKQLKERQKNLENYSESGWSAMSTLESKLEEIEASLCKEYGSFDSDTPNSKCSEQDLTDYDDHYCIVCEKRFRNVKGLENHTRSRKHKENLDLLKQYMEEEDQKHFSDDDILSEEITATADKCDGNIDNGQAHNDSNANESVTKETSEDRRSKKRYKKSMKNKVTEESFNEDSELPLLEVFIVDPEMPNDSISQENVESGAPVKLKGKRAKESRKKLKEKPNIKIVDQRQDSEVEFKCVTCEFVFPTRNKLFNHLKSSGHSIYIPESSKSCTSNHCNGVKVKKKNKGRN